MFTIRGFLYPWERIQPYHFPADLIWCDGTFKLIRLDAFLSFASFPIVCLSSCTIFHYILLLFICVFILLFLPFKL